MRVRKAGDKYRPIVRVKKAKKGIPTVLLISGERYILEHQDQFRGGRK